jgi:RNA polymerase sigma factor (sigma-70 family)
MDEDVMILTLIAQRSQDALQRLYVKYRPHLHRFLWNQLAGNTFLIEEVIQDVFLAVWQSASSYRGEARVMTWLFSIARRSAIHILRKKGMYHSSLTMPLELVSDSDSSNEAQLEEESILNRVMLNDALGCLTEKLREVVLLVFVQGFTQQEVSQILDIPLGTVKSRLYAARSELYAHLKQKEA